MLDTSGDKFSFFPYLGLSACGCTSYIYAWHGLGVLDGWGPEASARDLLVHCARISQETHVSYRMGLQYIAGPTVDRDGCTGGVGCAGLCKLIGFAKDLHTAGERLSIEILGKFDDLAAAAVGGVAQDGFTFGAVKVSAALKAHVITHQE